MEFIETLEFESIYKDMQAQFPKAELKTYEHLKEIAGDNYRIYQVIENEPVGYVILFETEDFIFIDYVAVFKEFHSRGFGGKILENLKQAFHKRGCFLEVEKPNFLDKNTLRRIKFYEKYGAEKLDVNYIYPNNEGGLPMDLYYISYDNKKPSNSDIKQFITALFKAVHFDIENCDEILKKIAL